MIFNIKSSNNLRPVNEVYFGKTKSIQEIENALDHFRNKYMGKYNPYKVNVDPEIIAINRMFENQFGFGTFAFQIVPDPQYNAYTCPISYRFDVNTYGIGGKENLLADKNTFKFNKDMDYACIVNVTTGLLFNPNFTTEEVMACILHEIGHNFYFALNKKNAILVNIYKVLIFAELASKGWILDLLSLTNTFESLDNKLTEITKKNRICQEVIGAIDYIGGIINTLKAAAYSLMQIFSFNLIYIFGGAIKNIAKKALNPITYIILPINYRDERNADNFATMYGYGQALSSCLAKFDEAGNKASNIVNTIETVPYISTLYNMIPQPIVILFTAFNEHPEGITRAKDQLNMLEAELKRADIDPKMKKCIQSDINTINKQIANCTDISKGFKDPDLARHLYNRLLYKMTGSKTIKDILLDDRHKFEEYDKTFYNSLSKS